MAICKIIGGITVAFTIFSAFVMHFYVSNIPLIYFCCFSSMFIFVIAGGIHSDAQSKLDDTLYPDDDNENSDRERDFHNKTSSKVQEITETGEIIDECIVCYLPIYANDELLKCPACKSLAHKAHFLEWVKIKGCCPNCGTDLQYTKLGEV